MAPAVLGLESLMFGVGLLERGIGLSRPLGDVADMIEEMLPDRECPGRVVAVLEVSLDTSDSGLGMNSRVSENPTRALVPALGCFGVLSVAVTGGVGAVSSCGIGTTSSVGAGGSGCGSMGTSGFCSKPVGLVGALLPLARELSKTGG